MHIKELNLQPSMLILNVFNVLHYNKCVRFWLIVSMCFQTSTWQESQNHTGLSWAPRGPFRPSTGLCETCVLFYAISQILLFLTYFSRCTCLLLSVKYVLMIFTGSLGARAGTANSLPVLPVTLSVCSCVDVLQSSLKQRKPRALEVTWMTSSQAK